MTASASTPGERAPALEPVRPGERIAELDVVRGFALFGVLLAYTAWNLGQPPEETWSATDHVANRVMLIAVDSKAFSLFTFLFGLGFAIQLSRAQARGASVPAHCSASHARPAKGSSPSASRSSSTTA